MKGNIRMERDMAREFNKKVQTKSMKEVGLKINIMEKDSIK